MKRYLKAFAVLSLITFLASCKKDDDASIPPPRDPAVQYVTEKADIEAYLKAHYIEVDEDYNVVIDSLDAEHTVSIWDRQADEFLKKVEVTRNNVLYTLYYIVLNEGSGEAPTRADDIYFAYRGMTFKGVQFDYTPFPDRYHNLSGLIAGWQEIIPKFKGGTYVDVPGSPDPAQYVDYGAGVMFIPSGLGYFNESRPNLPSYSPTVFSFKLYDVEYVDSDNDGILSKYETEPTDDTTDPADTMKDIKDVDTDNDGTPDYLDPDDDGDGYYTKEEIRIPDTDPAQYYEFDAIPACTEGGSLKKHLDPACH